MRIGELAKATETNVETIRYYERIGLLPLPGRSAANYRVYGRPELERLSFVRRARLVGFTLEQVRDLLALADDAARPCGAIDEIANAHLAGIERKIADLSALQSELRRMLDTCRRDTVADCRIVQMLAPR